MEIGEKFKNINYYNDCMAKGMIDKLWFTKYLTGHCTVVDFGCADGSMLNALVNNIDSNDNTYIGYDISDTMVAIAKSKFSCSPSVKVSFTADWDNVIKKLAKAPSYNKKILILSSVIHEVYSYSTEAEVAEFWERILNANFDYIFIRDMMLSQDADRMADDDIRSKVFTGIINGYVTSEKYYKDFEKNFGDITFNKNLIHFLMKYRWKINWEREVKENYFPITIEQLLKKFESKYNVNYLERFIVPFINDCIYKDFGIHLKDNTHIKLFLELKKK